MMKILIAFTGLLALVAARPSKLVCYYDSRSYVREGQARMLPQDLEPALSSCTHLVYGYAGINPDTYRIEPLNKNLDVDSIHANYQIITKLKNKYPYLQVLLSVGGDADTENPGKYNRLLESPPARTAFVNSAMLLIEQYNFDGIDLGWQFPKIKPKKIRSTLGSIWHGIKNTFRTSVVDDKEVAHREGFTALVRELNHALSQKRNMELVITVLPNVNSTIYYDVPSIINNVDFVNLATYNYYNSARNPKEADYTAPIYAPPNRNPKLNIDTELSYWLTAAPRNKIVIGISTFGRTWALDSDSEITGVPPLHADGPGAAGPDTKTEGLLSYPEVCAMLINSNKNLRKVTDPSKRFGTYAYRLPDNDGNGIWVSYEDPDTAGEKVDYAKAKKLGGVSIVDLSLDDFRGLCNGVKYPILRAAKSSSSSTARLYPLLGIGLPKFVPSTAVLC